MRRVCILMVLFCLGVFIPAVHAEGPAPAAPQAEDPPCWRVSPECVSSVIRWGEGRDTKFYVDLTNVCADMLYIFTCIEITRGVGGTRNSCDYLTLTPGETFSVYVFNIEEPTERYSVKAFGIKNREVGLTAECVRRFPGFDSDPF